MPKPQSGYTLITVLILLLTMSLLTLSTISQLKTTYLLQSHLITTQSALDKATAQIHLLSQQSPTTCLIPLTTNLPDKPDTWWQNNACPTSNFYYIYESLTADPCASIGELQAQYYRLTLVSLPKAVQDMKVFIQTTFVRAIKLDEPCQGSKHTVAIGQQMLREI